MFFRRRFRVLFFLVISFLFFGWRIRFFPVFQVLERLGELLGHPGINVPFCNSVLYVITVYIRKNLLFLLSPSALLHPSSGTSLLSPTVSHRPRLWSTLGTRNLDFTLVKPSPRGTLGNWKLETWSVMAMGPKDVGSVRKLGT